MISIITEIWYKRFRLVMEKSTVSSVGTLGKVAAIIRMVEAIITQIFLWVQLDKGEYQDDQKLSEELDNTDK